MDPHRSAGSLEIYCRVRRERRAAVVPHTLCVRHSAGGPAFVDHHERPLLPSRCMARWCVPRRPRGLLLSPLIRCLIAATHRRRTRACCRGRMRPAQVASRSPQHHRRDAAMGRSRSQLEPRRPVALGAGRDHGARASRQTSRAVPRRQRVEGTPSFARTPRQRRITHREDSHLGRWRHRRRG